MAVIQAALVLIPLTILIDRHVGIIDCRNSKSTVLGKIPVAWRPYKILLEYLEQLMSGIMQTDRRKNRHGLPYMR